MQRQRTLRSNVSCVGVGLHSGKEVRLELKPADVDSGIIFLRTDLPTRPKIHATAANVTATLRATTLEENGAKVKNTDTKLGLRDLAYPINDETKGFYVVLKVSADETALYQFNRKVKINPAVLRHLVTIDQE